MGASVSVHSHIRLGEYALSPEINKAIVSISVLVLAVPGKMGTGIYLSSEKKLINIIYPPLGERTNLGLNQPCLLRGEKAKQGSHPTWKTLKTWNFVIYMCGKYLEFAQKLGKSGILTEKFG